MILRSIHPNIVISGYRLALKEAVKYIEANLQIKLKKILKDKETLMKIAKTSLSSKLINDESNFFSSLLVEAILNVKTTLKDQSVFPLKSIKIQKVHGQSLKESQLVNGIAISSMRASLLMPKIITKAKIVCLDMNLSKFRAPLGVQILVDDPTNLEKIRLREMDITKERCMKIINSGVNVVVCSKSIDEFAVKYFVEAKVIAIRRVDKMDLKMIAKSTQATILTTFADNNGEEKFDPSCIGQASEVYEEKIGDNDFIFFTKCKNNTAQTIFIRGSNEFMLDEIERNIHDSLKCLKSVLESSSVVAGGGSFESALSLYLGDYAGSFV